MPSTPTRPAFELRICEVHLTVQRIPGWLVTAVATAVGSVLAAWFTSL
ncbi:hypothetical protein ACFUEM_00885 [Streptomyces anulatus]